MTTLGEFKRVLVDMLDDAERDACQELCERMRQIKETDERLRLLTLMDAMAEASRALRVAIERAERF